MISRRNTLLIFLVFLFHVVVRKLGEITHESFGFSTNLSIYTALINPTLLRYQFQYKMYTLTAKYIMYIYLYIHERRRGQHWHQNWRSVQVGRYILTFAKTDIHRIPPPVMPEMFPTPPCLFSLKHNSVIDRAVARLVANACAATKCLSAST